MIHGYAGDLDEIRFTSIDGVKPRAWLMAYVYGFTKDSNLGEYSCDMAFDLGRTMALSN